MFLASQEKVFQECVRHVPNPIAIKDASGTILYSNAAFDRIFLHDAASPTTALSVLSKYCRNYEEALQNDKAAIASGSSDTIEEFRTIAGNLQIFQTKRMRFRLPDETARLLVMRSDVTNIYSNVQSLRAQNDDLQNFSAIVAHDLRSPISSMISGLRLLQRDKATTLSETSDRYVTMMIESATSLAMNVESVLAIAGQEKDAIRERFVECDLNAAIADVLHRLSDQCASSDATIDTSDLPTLHCEPQLVRQLFQNLIENSLKYRNPARKLQITIEHLMIEGSHVICVQDTGYGIPPMLREQMFEMFERGADHGAAGLGIGLSLCKRIVELHHGKIWMDREYSGGCRMVFSLGTFQGVTIPESAERPMAIPASDMPVRPSAVAATRML